MAEMSDTTTKASEVERLDRNWVNKSLIVTQRHRAATVDSSSVLYHHKNSQTDISRKTYRIWV